MCETNGLILCKLPKLGLAGGLNTSSRRADGGFQRSHISASRAPIYRIIHQFYNIKNDQRTKKKFLRQFFWLSWKMTDQLLPEIFLFFNAQRSRVRF